MNLNERSVTRKSNYGFEPVNNTVFGINATYFSEVPFLTRMANKLPNVNTDVQSNISIKTELAFLRSRSPRNQVLMMLQVYILMILREVKIKLI